MKQLGQNSFKIVQKVLIQIAIIIFVVESLIMQVLPFLELNLTSFGEAMLDATLLSLASTPFIYWFVVNPFIDTHDSVLEKVSHMAYHDPLTGLANRRLLNEYIDKDLAYYLEPTNKGALLLIDLDGFKAVNDTYGHLAGDKLLIEIGERLSHITRENDVVARIGGDEFVIIINKLDMNDTTAQENSLVLSQKILAAIQEPIYYNEVKLEINASIGIRVYNSKQINFESLLREADSAMYDSKKNGKGCATFFKEV